MSTSIALTLITSLLLIITMLCIYVYIVKKENKYLHNKNGELRIINYKQDALLRRR